MVLCTHFAAAFHHLKIHNDGEDYVKEEISGTISHLLYTSSTTTYGSGCPFLHFKHSVNFHFNLMAAFSMRFGSYHISQAI